MDLTQKRLMELLRYEPETGKFFNAVSRGKARAGQETGSVRVYGIGGIKYVYVDLHRKRYHAARLAHLYMTGEWPRAGYDMDHINGDSLDNRWCNLRVATRSDNLANTRRKSVNTSGFKGVHWNKTLGKWIACIKVNYRSIHLGCFEDPAEAHAAYVAAADKYRGEFARAA